MALQTHIDTRPVEGFAHAIAAFDFDGIAWNLHPDVRFRALTPDHAFSHFGSDSAISTLESWFGKASLVEVLSSEMEPIGDGVRLSYRLRMLEGGSWSLIEQHMFCTLDDGLVTDVSLISSGNCPEF